MTLAALVAVPAATPGAAAEAAHGPAGAYVNPVSAGMADTYADPAVIRSHDGYWYAFGTTDPLRSGEGKPHFLPISRSADLVHWDHVADALDDGNRPDWAAADASYWAPDVTYRDGRYWLYYVVTQTTTTAERNDSAIAVATAPTPAGPWTTHDEPVVAPRHGPGGSDDFKWTYDPAHVVDTDGTRYLYYGSYYGGIWVTRLSTDGTRAMGEPVMVATDNRFEGAYVVRRGGWWYLFASSGDCCAGPTTGYSVFVGRSRSVRGPFLDREGVPLTASRTGGTVVLSPNGNRWVGTGHNAMVTDLAGQDWIVYHAIDRRNPYLDEPYGINRRPMLIDRLDWVEGWPLVRGGRGASDTPQPAPVTRRPSSGPAPLPLSPAGTAPTGSVVFSEDFDGERPRPGWTWLRTPAARIENGRLVWPTQDADLHKDSNSASLLLRDAPEGAWTVETKVRLDVGVETVRNYQQAGVLAYVDDDRYLRLAHTAIWNTRQTEFAQEQAGGRAAGGGGGGAGAPPRAPPRPRGARTHAAPPRHPHTEAT
ncbi:family 43 glycosylhydrolase, partial [Streptomyces sp. NPDC059720]|uniref:family 43 glycosylhydrolase n=1 Tax=Streptomyces sp. NPDC059720 TaxID=3346924 RepID=UPI00367FC35D